MEKNVTSPNTRSRMLSMPSSPTSPHNRDMLSQLSPKSPTKIDHPLRQRTVTSPIYIVSKSKKSRAISAGGADEDSSSSGNNKNRQSNSPTYQIDVKKLPDNDNSCYRVFFEKHTCYDLMPPQNNKLVVLDEQLNVAKAFRAMMFNGVRAALLWNSTQSRFTGIFTVTDYIRVLLHSYRECSTPNKRFTTEHLYVQSVTEWRRMFIEAAARCSITNSLAPQHSTLIVAGPTNSLLDAMRLLNRTKIHRLPVFSGVHYEMPDEEQEEKEKQHQEKGRGDTVELGREATEKSQHHQQQHHYQFSPGEPLHIITYKRLLGYLHGHLGSLPRPPMLRQTSRELGMGVWDERIVTVTSNTPVHRAFELLLRHRISALPVLHPETGLLADIFSRFDVIYMTANQSNYDLNQPISEALRPRPKRPLHTHPVNTTIHELMYAFAITGVHRFFLVDYLGEADSTASELGGAATAKGDQQKKRLRCVLSLTDLFQFIMNQ